MNKYGIDKISKSLIANYTKRYENYKNDTLDYKISKETFIAIAFCNDINVDLRNEKDIIRLETILERSDSEFKQVIVNGLEQAINK